ncbi:GDSL-like lipase/acylhydrolase [Kordia sp. SMS9]|uniref:SGNH/GDSL hydrolase family protein n=1 Tax=Kordia sp. SMS9 TaxID=2282170 RepID=UPI000E0D9A46|nr:SGNH/GDSL hydrolase family protein [Kordia sp. SMS9]AXG69436.1 GDSL-like lipase/acylhydrolase [Kordia sp. SMS9]
MKYVRLIGINLLVLSGLLLIVAIVMYFIEVNRIQTFFAFTSDKQSEYFIPDSTTMFLHKPNIHIYDNWGTPEQKISTERRTNNLGFRDDADVIDKKPNEVRVLVAGDSHTDGVLRYNTQSFVNIWEEKLNATDTTRNYNCLNGGVGYYTFRNYHGFLKKFAYLKPDVFLINVFTGNDFRETVKFEDDRTSVANIYKSWYMRFRRKFQSAEQQAFPYIQGIEQQLYFESFPNEKERSMQIAKKYLLQIKELCKQQNIRLIITLLPSRIEVKPEFHKEIQTLFNLDAKTMNTNRELTATLINFLQEQHIEYLDLTPSLLDSTEKLYWDEDLHINPKAHELIGEFLFKNIEFLHHVNIHDIDR